MLGIDVIGCGEVGLLVGQLVHGGAFVGGGGGSDDTQLKLLYFKPGQQDIPSKAGPLLEQHVPVL